MLYAKSNPVETLREHTDELFKTNECVKRKLWNKYK